MTRIGHLIVPGRSSTLQTQTRHLILDRYTKKTDHHLLSICSLANNYLQMANTQYSIVSVIRTTTYMIGRNEIRKSEAKSSRASIQCPGHYGENGLRGGPRHSPDVS